MTTFLIAYEVTRTVNGKPKKQRLTRDVFASTWAKAAALADLMEQDTNPHHQTRVTGISKG